MLKIYWDKYGSNRSPLKPMAVGEEGDFKLKLF